MIPAAAGRKGEPDLNDIAVQFRHVSMAFPGVLANDDVSLDIRKGEVFALVGENLYDDRADVLSWRTGERV